MKADNQGAAEAELIARDRLAHELMYFSRGNPVIYYGDEQGFTGTGGDQVARQTMFASQVPEYLDDDLLGTDSTHAQDNFNTDHPLYQRISELAVADRGASGAARTAPTRTATRSDGPGSTPSPGLLAQPAARVRRGAEQQRVGEDRGHPDLRRQRRLHEGLRRRRRRQLTTNGSRQLSVTVPALSTVVYKSASRSRGPTRHRAISLDTPGGVDRRPTRGCRCRRTSAAPRSTR